MEKEKRERKPSTRALVNEEPPSSSGGPKGLLRGNYKCGRCGQPKKGHNCPLGYDPTNKATSRRAASGKEARQDRPRQSDPSRSVSPAPAAARAAAPGARSLHHNFSNASVPASPAGLPLHMRGSDNLLALLGSPGQLNETLDADFFADFLMSPQKGAAGTGGASLGITPAKSLPSGLLHPVASPHPLSYRSGSIAEQLAAKAQEEAGTHRLEPESLPEGPSGHGPFASHGQAAPHGLKRKAGPGASNLGQQQHHETIVGSAPASVLSLQTPALGGALGPSPALAVPGPAAAQRALPLHSAHLQPSTGPRTAVPPPPAFIQPQTQQQQPQQQAARGRAPGAPFDPFSPPLGPTYHQNASSDSAGAVAPSPLAVAPQQAHKRYRPDVSSASSPSTPDPLAVALALTRVEAEDLASAALACRDWKQAADTVWLGARKAHIKLLPLCGARVGAGTGPNSTPNNSDAVPAPSVLGPVLARVPGLEELVLRCEEGRDLCDATLLEAAAALANSAAAARLQSLAIRVVGGGQWTTSPGTLRALVSSLPALRSLTIDLDAPAPRNPSSEQSGTQDSGQAPLPHGPGSGSVAPPAAPGPRSGLTELSLSSSSLETLEVRGVAGLRSVCLQCASLEELVLDMGPKTPQGVQDYKITRFMPLVSGTSQISGPQGATWHALLGLAESPLPSLRRLMVSGPHLTDKALEALVSGGSAAQWEALCVNHAAQVTVEGVEAVCRACPSLSHLDLSGCVALTDETLVHVARHLSKTLTRLLLAHCQMLSRSAVQRAVEELPRLALLDLGYSLVDRPRGSELADRNHLWDRVVGQGNTLQTSPALLAASAAPSAPAMGRPLTMLDPNSPVRGAAQQPQPAPGAGAAAAALAAMGGAATAFGGGSTPRGHLVPHGLGLDATAAAAAQEQLPSAAVAAVGSVLPPAAPDSARVIGKLGSCRRSLVEDFDPDAVGASQTLELRSTSLRALSLWGCTRVRALTLDCPLLSQLNLNLCRALDPARAKAPCPRLSGLSTEGCGAALSDRIWSGARAARDDMMGVSPEAAAASLLGLAARHGAGGRGGKVGLLGRRAAAGGRRGGARRSLKRADPFSDGDGEDELEGIEASGMAPEAHLLGPGFASDDE